MVHLVADDRDLVRPLRAEFKAGRLQLALYDAAKTFYNACDPKMPGCVLWDTAAPGPDPLVLLEQLARRDIYLPVIFLANAADTRTVVAAMKAGASNFLDKPPARDVLCEAVREAIAWDAENRARRRHAAKIQRRRDQLTPGEAEVLESLVSGSSNRQIADTLGLSVRAVEVRRAKLMKKMKAQNLPELVRLVTAAEDGAPP